MLSNDKVNVNLGCGGWIVPVTFIILLAPSYLTVESIRHLFQ